ncbi:hypothetical protein TNCV_3957091 [Trichonephila clavipes]|nr:hypothetical protein TNCV_3957091 [Trichonephila clavipes]
MKAKAWTSTALSQLCKLVVAMLRHERGLLALCRFFDLCGRGPNVQSFLCYRMPSTSYSIKTIDGYI